MQRHNSVRVRCNWQVPISLIKPHRPVSKITVARWIKTTLDNAGIDIGVFSAKSTRAASTTSAGVRRVAGVDFKAAGWATHGHPF